jgi:hypothetical protein
MTECAATLTMSICMTLLGLGLLEFRDQEFLEPIKIAVGALT